jgi:superfamily II DNA or RNA helicase
MQVSPIEVWDLLWLLGLPADWHVQGFLGFFENAARPSPSHEQLAQMARLFRAAEQAYGAVSDEDAARALPELSRLTLKKVLRALRDGASIPLKRLETAERAAAVRLMKAQTPLKHLISRHTRELLRRYHKAGKLETPIADRDVSDRFVQLTDAERRVYEQVEDYISSTYDNAAGDQRTAVGFVMTIYRRRLASSFAALASTLEGRLAAVQGQLDAPLAEALDTAEDLPDDEVLEEPMDADEAAELEDEALAAEEILDIEGLLHAVRRLPADSKLGVLLEELHALRAEGYRQAMVFTQYTATMDFIRERLVEAFGAGVICFSGRGGEIRSPAGSWQTISREKTKARFREGLAEIMVCTDAAAEGLNFQFCGALVNYDMPWNPMRVEQRIGRIDRLGQEYARIRILNLHYADTVEADVYDALRKRIDLFQSFVGRLQPILARLPGAIREVALGRSEQRDLARSNLIADIQSEVDAHADAGFDLDEVTAADLDEPPRPAPAYGLAELGGVLQRPDLLPPGVEVGAVGKKDFSYLAPGMSAPVRVTTDPGFYDRHADSLELWSPGSPIFPTPDEAASADDLQGMDLKAVLAQGH